MLNRVLIRSFFFVFILFFCVFNKICFFNYKKNCVFWFDVFRVLFFCECKKKKILCFFSGNNQTSSSHSNENFSKNSEVQLKIDNSKQIKKSLSKTSTGCGPSPPREIIMQSSMSMGTSPPPQSISTQVSFFEPTKKKIKQ